MRVNAPRNKPLSKDNNLPHPNHRLEYHKHNPITLPSRLNFLTMVYFPLARNLPTDSMTSGMEDKA